MLRKLSICWQCYTVKPYPSNKLIWFHFLKHLHSENSKRKSSQSPSSFFFRTTFKHKQKKEKKKVPLRLISAGYDLIPSHDGPVAWEEAGCQDTSWGCKTRHIHPTSSWDRRQGGNTLLWAVCLIQ